MPQNKLNIAMNSQNILLLAAFGVLVYEALPTIKENSVAAAEGGEAGSPSYIQQAKNILSAGNYGVLTTLYKIKAALSEAAALDFTAAASDSSIADIFGALGTVEPYLSRGKRNSVAKIVDSAGRVRDTASRLRHAKERVDSAGESGGRIEKLKAIAGELPALSGIPALTQYAKLRDIGDALTPILSMLPKKEESPPAAVEAEFTADEAGEMEDIYELVDMLDERSRRNRARK